MKSFIYIWVITLLACLNATPHTITHHILEDGKVWNYTGSRRIAPQEYQTEWYETYRLEGDTLIDSHQCLKLYLTSSEPNGVLDHSYFGAMYEEGECIYYIALGSTEPTLLYNFSCEPGTTVKVNNFELLINEKRCVKYRDNYLVVVDWSPIEEEGTLYHGIWIEGIGSPLDLMNNTPIWYDGCPYKELVTCKLNDQIIYDKDDFVASAQVVLDQEYFPEGTKWTEIRLDTLKYDSWYSKVGDSWVPNYETIEYYVQGEYTDRDIVYNKVYTNGPEWADSLTLFVSKGDYYGNSSHIMVTIPPREDGYIMWAGDVYQFDWNIGKGLYYRDIIESNSTGIVPYYFFYGVIDEIKEGDFGGVRPLKYVDLDGKAATLDFGYCIDTKGGRIIQGIGITEWNDGECLFGPPNPYFAMTGSYNDRHYRSMLVHFERGGEVLYDVWPEKVTVGLESPTLTSPEDGTRIYDLQGYRLLREPEQGIYIKEGKKITVSR